MVGKWPYQKDTGDVESEEDTDIDDDVLLESLINELKSAFSKDLESIRQEIVLLQQKLDRLSSTTVHSLK